MATEMPAAELHARFSSPGATPTDWAEGRRHIDEAEVFWLSTVRPDGRPHVTPLLAVWHDDAMYFCTGPDERKAKNLKQNAQCILTGTRFTSPEGTWFGLSDAIRAGKALVYRVAPTTILGFAKGEQFGQTRWRFA